jgi:PAS domain S-box-containing protein
MCRPDHRCRLSADDEDQIMAEVNLKRDFFLRIILPTLLAIILFTATIFTIIIPSFETNILDRKREMIRELTNSAWSVFEEFERKEKAGLLSRDDAQKEAVTRIESLRYGEERKDYFWITDMHPVMIMHPYRTELNDTDLTEYADPEGTKLFVEFAKIVRKQGDGYVTYMWQWKDDSSRIVPKLSYVKGFEPWNWIIGTGIYIEDVNEEIAALTTRLIIMSLSILAVLALILLFVMLQSAGIERKKQDAESNLRESEAKYRALVEASTEGLVMLLDHEYVYANKFMLHLLGCEENDPATVPLHELLTGGHNRQSSAGRYFADLQHDAVPQRQFEGELRNVSGQSIDVLLFVSDITYADRMGYTIIVKDISSQKHITGQLDESQAKFNNLTNNIRIGVFRTTLGRKGKFIEANQAVLNILGYKTEDQLYEKNISDLFQERGDRRKFFRTLTDRGSVKNALIQIRRGDGSASTISVSAVLVRNEDGSPVFCDGILDDVTERTELDTQRDNLISELQTSLFFLNQPLKHYAKKIISCDMSEPIHKVASLMSQKKYSAALITADSGEFIGIITDRDLRDRAVASRHDLNRPAFDVMTSPLISIPEHALVFEAFSLMVRKSTRHLVVVNADGQVVGTISSEELLQVQQGSATFLLREIEQAGTIDDLIKGHDRLPVIVKTLVDSGARIKNITRIISSVSDSIINRLIAFAVEDLGEPPVPFAFIALGSEGREEQTLITDQDNAIIYQDVDAEENKEVHAYFVSLGKQVCDSLNRCGYAFCKGNNMASNPQWTQPLAQWITYFQTWIQTSDPQDLIEIGIFFDFRCVYGEATLADSLRDMLFQYAQNKAVFFQHLVRNCLTHKPPVGLLGNIVVKSSGAHPETFDIKKALMPVMDFARIYALRYAIRETNTLDRLHRTMKQNILNRTTYNELNQAYNFLMQLRFKHQTASLADSRQPDNFINPENLSQIERKTLKNTFTQISSIQKKLSYEFTGDAL